MRNCNIQATRGHEIISRNSEKAVGLTATPIMNKQEDMIGASVALDMPEEFKSESKWFIDKKNDLVNTATIREFRERFVDRVTDEILNLPPITHHVVNFPVAMEPSKVADYNEILLRARRLRVSMERNRKASQVELQRLMKYLGEMQQFLVSPLIAELGAAELHNDKSLILKAAESDTGALVALQRAIKDLNGEGFSRVMVAACHTTLLKVAHAYLQRTSPEIGTLIIYEGSMTMLKRKQAVSAFLNESQTVLLMSIDAGGTGLHLVPGANAVIFWGSRPFSPMQVRQTSKRVHRIGQEHPVKVLHLMATGSVDSAIDTVHRDKTALSNAMIDEDMQNIESKGGRWRTKGRIVDGCKFLSDDGFFTEEEVTEEHALQAIQARDRERDEANRVLSATQPSSHGGSMCVQNLYNASVSQSMNHISMDNQIFSPLMHQPLMHQPSVILPVMYQQPLHPVIAQLAHGVMPSLQQLQSMNLPHSNCHER